MSSTSQRLTPSSSSALLSLKRPAEDDNDIQEQRRNKRHHTMTTEETDLSQADPQAVQEPILAEDARMAIKYLEAMEDELRCGCCTELLYRPVEIFPCMHYFCGSCTVLFVQNGGTSCPACRQPSTSVAPSRILQGFIDALLRIYPEKQRTQSERDQADEIYQPTSTISIPPPKPPTRDDALVPRAQSHNPPPDNLARPCPHCLPNNEFQWTCPHPLADPETDPEHAWNLNNGIPPHHAWCGYCDELHAVGAPTTTRCSICRTSFCGLGVPHLCAAASIQNANLPVSISSLSGLIQSGDIYDAFNGNAVEVDVLFDWLREDGRGPRGMLFEILNFVQSNPTTGFRQLIDQGVFPAALENDRDENTPAPAPISAPPSPRALSPPLVSNTDNTADTDTVITPQVDEAPPAPVPQPADQAQDQTEIPSDPPAEPQTEVATTATNAEEPQEHQQEQQEQLLPPPPPPPPAPAYTKICRDCAQRVFFWGVYEWWAREQVAIINRMNAAKAAAENATPVNADAPVNTDATTEPEASVSENLNEVADRSDDDASSSDDDGAGPDEVPRLAVLPEWVISEGRKDCEEGRHCMRQGDMAHAREFNHVIRPPVPQVIQPVGESTNTSGDTIIGGNTISGSGPDPTSANETTPNEDVLMPDSVSAINAGTNPVITSDQSGGLSAPAGEANRTVQEVIPEPQLLSGASAPSISLTQAAQDEEDEEEDVDVEMVVEGSRDADLDMTDAEAVSAHDVPIQAGTSDDGIVTRNARELEKSVLASIDTSAGEDVSMEEADAVERAVVGVRVAV
ncbi:hypothetical protein FRC02_011143 [Tulasnella sp. 418]|nr:hypothetical protein FRC02_011143 [Tulasnella sp. 418]